MDNEGRTLLVRKRGTQAFMQAGGKVEHNESPRAALERELVEELGCQIAGDARHLGQYQSVAANEVNALVVAELFAVELLGQPEASSEIEECVWVSKPEAELLALAPLTRDHVLPLLESVQ